MAFTLAPSFPVPKAGGTIDPLSQYGSLLGLGIGALLPMLLGNRGQQQQQQNPQNGQAQQTGIGGLLAKLSNPNANVTPGDAAGLPGGTVQSGGMPNGATATPQGMPGQGQQLPPPAQPVGGGGPNAALVQAGLHAPGGAPFAGATGNPLLTLPPNLQQLIQQRLLGGGGNFNMNPNTPGFGNLG